MAQAAFYWYPGGGSALDKITLNCRISRAEPFELAQAEDSYSGGQNFVRSFAGTRRRVRIAIDRVSLLTSNGKDDYRRLQNLVSHLKAGGAVGFTTDTTKAVASYQTGGFGVGYQYAVHAGNAFSAWESSATLASGDEVVIETEPMIGISEWHKLSAYSSTQFTFSTDKTRYDLANTNAMIRWHRFWPALRLPSDQLDAPIITDEHGIGWSFEVELEVAAEIYFVPMISQSKEIGNPSLATALGTTLDLPFGGGGNKFGLDSLLTEVQGIARQGRAGMNYDPRTSFDRFARGLTLRRF